MNSSTSSNVQTSKHSGQWVTVSMLAFGVFVVGTGEFVLAGLLPLLSRSLHISVSTAGQVITVFALTCALAGPVLTTFTRGWQRRQVLLIAIMVYLVGSVWTAQAPHYWHVIAGQILAAIGVGLFVPNATVTAAALVPEAHRGKAIAIVVSGFTVAASLGAPFGTVLGVIFEPATGESSLNLAGLMLTLGIVGTVGNLAAGVFADRIGGPKVVAIALVWLIASLLAIPHAIANLSSAYVVVAFFAIAAFAITTPQQHILIALKPQSAAVLISLNQAILYLAIALSGLVGGFGVDWIGAGRVSYIAAALAAMALLLSQFAKRIIR